MSRDRAMRAGDFAPCALCGKGVMHTGVPLFYRVRIETMGVNARAVQSAHAMELYMGGHVALARVFEDPDIATPVVPEATALVCQTCGTQPHLLAQLSEAAQPKEEAPAS
jgi:hypothetical protein